MNAYLTSRQFVRIAATGLVVVIIAFAIIKSRHSEDAAILMPLERAEAAALVTELAHCRTITSDETMALESCRRVWAENRRLFFRPTRPPQSSTDSIPNVSTSPVKSQDRIPSYEVKHQQGEPR